MLASTVTRFPRDFGRPSSWLICLDLQRDYVVPGRPLYAQASAGVALACSRVLDFARTANWRVVHSQFRPSDRSWARNDLFGAPIEGLRPLTSEAVFVRRSLSAFSNPDFAAELRAARGDDIYLIGFSLADTCLATALAAVDQGLTLTLVEDAVGVGGNAAHQASEIARSLLEPFTRRVSSCELARSFEQIAQ